MLSLGNLFIKSFVYMREVGFQSTLLSFFIPLNLPPVAFKMLRVKLDPLYLNPAMLASSP